MWERRQTDRQSEVYPLLKSLVLYSGSTGGGFDPRKHLTMSGGGVVRRIEERSELLVAHRMEARDAIKQPMIETTGHPVIQSQGSVVSGLRPPGDVRS